MRTRQILLSLVKSERQRVKKDFREMKRLHIRYKEIQKGFIQISF